MVSRPDHCRNTFLALSAAIISVMGRGRFGAAHRLRQCRESLSFSDYLTAQRILSSPGRRRESFRLMRQLLTESVMLALIGGGLGCLLALWGISALVALEPTKVFQAVRVKADGAVLWFSLGVSLLTGVMFGLPAIRYSKAIWPKP